MKHTILVFSLMVLSATAFPVRQLDALTPLLGSIGIVLPTPPPGATPTPTATPPPSPGGGDGGFGIGIGGITSVGDDATVFGGIGPGSGVVITGEDATATLTGATIGLGVGGAGGAGRR
eukprot:TRINITY_DN24949_c0_g1_i1.p1 TRINITY_DN24949_c0_g1~~TRINITY_DN24949_c0_g1_i1.p1  ORF type:complete len:119 (+),score=19.14 TRINITY_DN24949_c0_g1_i1:313-669(+)